MPERILYHCTSCGHQGTFWFRKGKYFACVKCEWPLDAAPQEDWAPEKTVFWKRPDGTYTLPAQRDARMPPEYERVEVQETADKRRIVREIDREEREKWERVHIGKQMLNEQDEAGRRSELRQAMFHGRHVENPDGTKRFIPPMSAAQRDFARYAMDRNNNRPREQYKGAFFLQALEFDASNREPYRGPDGLGRREK